MDRIKAVIFDFDGVLFNTEPLHFALFRQVLETEGVRLDSDRYHARYVGLTDKACFHAVLTDFGKPVVSTALLDQLVQRKTDLMQEALRQELPILSGVREFVDEATGTYRTAIASGALRREIVLSLELSDMTSMFEHISAAEDVSQGKPAPSLYLHALDALNRRSSLYAHECVAIEDTPHGIEAAHKAGMSCIGVATTVPERCLMQADLVVASLDSLPLRHLLAQM